MSLIWPSDPLSQCHVDSPRQEEQEGGADDDLDGDDLTEEMSRLNIGSSLPPSLVATTQQKVPVPVPGPEPKADSLADGPIPATHKYPSLNSSMNLSQASFGPSSAIAPDVSNSKGGHSGRAKSAQWRKTRAAEDLGLSSGLLRVIFCDITRRERGKRYARLGMDDSGRWRVVRYSNPSEVFPSMTR